MRAVDQWSAIEAKLGDGWDVAQLSFSVEDPGASSEAASVLAPLGPGRAGGDLRILVERHGGGPEQLRNLLGHLDRKRIWGSLELVEARSEQPAVEDLVAPKGVLLVDGWDSEIAKLPAGWRDLLCELRLASSDHLPRAALLGAPLNPTRNPDAIALRFRASSGGGYGTAAGMVRRCLERMDAEGITGSVRVLHALSDTENVGTQGPVWRIAGRSV